MDIDNHRQIENIDATLSTDLPFGGKAIIHHLGSFSNRKRFPRSLILRLTHSASIPFAWRSRSPRARALWDKLEELNCDIIIADDVRLAPFAIYGKAKSRIINTHNFESKLLFRIAKIQPNNRPTLGDAKHCSKIERLLFPKADQIWAVQEDETNAYIESGLKEDRVRIIPNIIPDHCFSSSPTIGEKGIGLFVGSLWYPPNENAVISIIQIAKLMEKSNNTGRFLIAGTGASKQLELMAKTTDRVELLGFVPDILDLTKKASVVIIPLSCGAGTKLKTLEAMAAGKPILTTPVGAEGLGLVDGKHAIIRDLGSEFNKSCFEMLENPGRYTEMGLEAQQHARKHFSQLNLNRAVASAIQCALEQRPPAACHLQLNPMNKR